MPVKPPASVWRKAIARPSDGSPIQSANVRMINRVRFRVICVVPRGLGFWFENELDGVAGITGAPNSSNACKWVGLASTGRTVGCPMPTCGPLGKAPLLGRWLCNYLRVKAVVTMNPVV